MSGGRALCSRIKKERKAHSEADRNVSRRISPNRERESGEQKTINRWRQHFPSGENPAFAALAGKAPAFSQSPLTWIWWMIIGSLAKSTMGLGTVSVSGRRRVPKPPTRIRARTMVFSFFFQGGGLGRGGERLREGKLGRGVSVLHTEGKGADDGRGRTRVVSEGRERERERHERERESKKNRKLARLLTLSSLRPPLSSLLSSLSLSLVSPCPKGNTSDFSKFAFFKHLQIKHKKRKEKKIFESKKKEEKIFNTATEASPRAPRPRPPPRRLLRPRLLRHSSWPAPPRSPTASPGP